MLPLGAGSSSRIVLRRAAWLLRCVGLAVAVSACSGAVESDVDASAHALVYGQDDRREYYEVDDVEWRKLFEQSVVVLAPRALAESLATADSAGVDPPLPTWGAASGLCAGEPFAEQPAIGFCTGVLVDWDLVLTAGHCASAWSTDEFRAVFRDYYLEPGRLALRPDDVYAAREVVTTVHDVRDDGTRIDYAWLRLARPAAAPRRPAAIHTANVALTAGDPLWVISAGGGVPLKSDAGGKVKDPRAERLDHFVADTDTSQGSSGAGVFANDRGLIGVLSTGRPDFVSRADGCLTTQREEDPSRAGEQYTYSARAVEGLCAVTESPLCDRACPQPCQVPDSARPADPPDSRRGADSGCSTGGRASSYESLIFGLIFAAMLRRRRASR